MILNEGFHNTLTERGVMSSTVTFGLVGTPFIYIKEERDRVLLMIML